MTKKRVLGRGLDALFSSGEPDSANGALKDIPVAEVLVNPRQARKYFAEEKMRELVDSIQAVGLLQPIMVTEKEQGYELISGERRLRAYRLLEREFIPAIVKEMPEAERAAAVIIENIQRENLNPLEEAAAYGSLLEEFGLTQQAVAQRVGKSRTHVTNSLRLLGLPAPLQRMLAEGKLSAGHARALLVLKPEPFQLQLAERIAREGLSVRQAEAMVRQAMQSKAGGSTRRAPNQADPQLQGLLKRKLGGLQERVAVRGTRHKGRLEIRYQSEEELERWLEALAAEGRPMK